MKIIEPSDNIIEILKEDKNKNMLSFLYFTAKWCGPCNRIFPVLLKTAKIFCLASSPSLISKSSAKISSN